jgi:3-phosphoshikimate 1-carboxyvinyltransferase
MSAQTPPVRSAWSSLKGVKLARVEAAKGPIRGSLAVPGSKSATNRALILAGAAGLGATGERVSRVSGLLRSDDSYWCMEALHKLGAQMEDDGVNLTIGAPHEWACPAEPIFIGSAGTTGRFLTAVLALSTRLAVEIAASEQLSSRPMEPLFEALRSLGARFEYGEHRAFPVTILPRRGGAGTVQISGSVSSQFISGLLMGTPLLGRPVEVLVTDRIVQADYVRITLAMMKSFGVEVEVSDEFDRFRVQPGSYQPTSYVVEADASTASYFLALAAVTGGDITLENLPSATLQPDIRFIQFLRQMGCRLEQEGSRMTIVGPARNALGGRLRGGFTADMNACSDTALTLAAIAPFADAPIEIIGVEHIRRHESDRLRVMAASLCAAGVPVEERPDGLRIEPAQPRFARLDTHDDHRVAMSLTVLGVAGSGIELTDPGCVSKTCPDFFGMIEKLGAKVTFG